MNRIETTVAAACLATATSILAGCSTSGTAEGALIPAQPPFATDERQPVAGLDSADVVFSWESSTLNPLRGDINTTLPDGRTFSGTYFQVTQTVSERDFGPMWEGWGPYWGYDDFDGYVVFYSGRVVANLKSPDGERMRCQFVLAEPTDGLAGGGEGSCLLHDGTRIANVVLYEDE